MGNRNKKKPVEKFKSRKELRKDKRLQKKANRVHFQKRKKELKMEYKERQRQKNLDKTATNAKGSNMSKLPKKFEKSNDRKYSDMDDDDDAEDDIDPNDDDEEIESDFELSDQELEQKTKSVAKQSSIKTALKTPASTQLELDHQRLKKQEQLLRKDMGKQRIKQLKMANEDEDKTIHRLEKLLKIDKSKSKSKKRGIPKMFNDGLDYALEMCLPENIEKMYAAAKEADDAEHEQSDSEWQEDFAMATGDLNDIDQMQSSNATAKSKMNNLEKSTAKSEKSVNSEKAKKRFERLREIEAKYFGDELASDLSDIDSEFERSADESEADSSGNDKESGRIGRSDDDIDDDDDDDSAPEEIGTITKSSKKRKLEKSQQKSITKHHDNDNDDDEEMDSSDTESDSNDSAMMDSENDEQNDDNDDGSEIDEQKPEIWEDIYGRKRDKDGNVINEHGNECALGTTTANTDGKYIPPHQRARLAAAAEASMAGSNTAENKMDPKRIEKLMRLKRLLKGQLNRLSEANMHKIATELDNLYMQNSRHDMNTTLSTLICDALISPALAPERMVMEHAMLIAALHANVGTEVGANLLETLVDRFHQMIETGIEQYDVEDKTLDNIVFILCHMYAFKIFHQRLIYELLSKLIEKFCEKSVECILLALRSVGFSLRKDDPAALKELIINIQKRTSEASDSLKSNARLKYMLDVLTAIKNNNVNRIPNYDPTLAEHLRKILKTVCVNGKYVNTLNISLDDLLNVQMRGKWWVVGSAWTGNIDDIGVAAAAATDKMHQTTKAEQKFSEQLLDLARKQRMNTDERRNIFCILMSAEDYIDAFEKILHLAIKDHRVAVSVIIHCCLSENQYNPYYAVVAQKFCDYDRKYQLAIQYAIWDRIKDIQSHTNSQIGNLAQFLNHLITNGAQAISVLKIIEFGELEKSTLRLVRKILLGILLGNEDICKEVFQRIAPSAQLKAFKDSIRLFMHHFLLKGGAKNGIAADKMQLLKERIKIADKSLDTATIRF